MPDNDTNIISPEYKALMERWDGFLDKIKARYKEVLEQAEGPLKDVINSLEYDTVVIHNVLNGLKNQSATQLYKKTEESWEKMETELEKIRVPFNTILKIRQKHENLREWMDEDFERFSIKTFADAARKIEENVRKHVD